MTITHFKIVPKIKFNECKKEKKKNNNNRVQIEGTGRRGDGAVRLLENRVSGEKSRQAGR